MKRHYSAVIVACCFLIMFVNQGLPSTSFNVWQSYLVRVPGVGDGGVAAVLLVRTAVSFLAIFAVTPYYKRLDLRWGVAGATLLTVAGFALYGLAGDRLWLYCAGSVLTGVGYGLGGVVASTALIGNWFAGDVGTAAGIAGVGSGVAGMLVPLAVAPLVRYASLADAFFVVAAAAAVLGLVMFAFVRSEPQQLGMKPFQVSKKPPRSRRLAAREAAARAFEAPAPLPASQRRLMGVALALLGADAVSASGYFSVLLSTSGIDLSAAAAVTALLGASLALGKFLSGKLFDIIGTQAASALFFAALVAGAALCANVSAGGVGLACAAAVLFGAGCSLSTTGLSVWSLELTSPAEKMDTVRDFMIAYAFGGFAFNALPGALKAVTGTYEASFAVFAVGSLVSAALVLFVLSRHERARHRRGGAVPPPAASPPAASPSTGSGDYGKGDQHSLLH